MAKNVDETSTKTLQEKVADKIKSRSAKPVILDGKASRFDIRRYGGVDYRAGGLLAPRMVANNDARIQECRAAGFEFPGEWDASMPPLEFSGMVLMLRSTEHTKEAQKWHLEHAQSLDRSKAPSDVAQAMDFNKREGAQFIGSATEQAQVTLNADTKVRTMGPE